MISVAQIRNGRDILGWRPTKLATRSGLPLDLIRRYEEETEILDPATVEILRSTLEAAGVEFIPENGSGAGVRLRRGG